MSTRTPKSTPSEMPPESSQPAPDEIAGAAPTSTGTEPSTPSAVAPTDEPGRDAQMSPVQAPLPAEADAPAEEDVRPELSPSALREISEAIAEAFPLVTGATELVLVDVDPHRVHAYWTVQPEDLAVARGGMGAEGEGAELVLRFHDLTVADGEGVSVHAPLDIEVDGLQNDWYIDLWSDAHSYLAELGLRAPDGRFTQLVQSNPVQTPRATEVQREILPEVSVLAKLATEVAAPQTASALQTESRVAPAAEHPLPPANAAATHADRASVRTLAAPVDQVLEPEFPDLGGGEPLLPPALVPHFPNIDQFDTAPGTELAGGAAQPALDLAGAGQWPAPSEPWWDSRPAVLDREPPSGPPSPELPTATSEPAPSTFEPAPSSSTLLSYSSSTLARRPVDLEVNVELHVYGRARPGADLKLFGRHVALRPDGSFSFRRPLRNGAIVVPVLFADDGTPLEDGEA